MEDWSTLEYMDYWLRTIYSHTSHNTTTAVCNSRLSPPILVVGTHRNSLSADEVEQKRLVRNQQVSTIWNEPEKFSTACIRIWLFEFLIQYLFLLSKKQIFLQVLLSKVFNILFNFKCCKLSRVLEKNAGYSNMGGFEGLKKIPYSCLHLLGLFHFLLVLSTHLYHFQSLKAY